MHNGKLGFWVRDKRRPGGKMTSCGRYDGDYSSRGVGYTYIKISNRV